MKIIDSKKFISSLPDSRYLLLYPELINKLSSLIKTNTKDRDLLNIFPVLLDYLDPEKRTGIINIINLSSSTILSNQFPNRTDILFSEIGNKQIPQMEKSEKDNLIAQSGLPFNSIQFLSLLNLLSKQNLDDILSTLENYQIEDLSSTFSAEQQKSIEYFEIMFDPRMIGVL
jgi:hypothetical protein